jgi:HAD superfamily hydrolase (TIGR01509 family)
MIRALIFDFDGTIVDTETPDYRSLAEIYEEHGCTLPLDFWALALGTSPSPVDLFDSLAEQLGEPLDRSSLHQRRTNRFHELTGQEGIRAGVTGLLRAARAGRVMAAVASSASRGWVEGHLTRLGIRDLFDCIRTSEDVARAKPFPDLYLAALEGLGISSREAVAIEDSPNGIRAAKAAGIFCIAVPNEITRRLDLSAADLRIESLADCTLEDLLAL